MGLAPATPSSLPKVLKSRWIPHCEVVLKFEKNVIPDDRREAREIRNPGKPHRIVNFWIPTRARFTGLGRDDGPRYSLDAQECKKGAKAIQILAIIPIPIKQTRRDLPWKS